jgi:hypothetical protein
MAVARLAISRLPEADREVFADMKLTYGMGLPGVRGITYYGRWKAGDKPSASGAFVEIGAGCQESWVQVAGTTIHELAHVLAGLGAGHGPDWKAACARLGLRRVLAAGTAYKLANFECDLRFALAALGKPDEGEPVCNLFGAGAPKLRPCAAGVGTRGGKSRGAGSGSRLRLFECECVPPVKARVARDTFAATCDCCAGHFHFVK